MTHPYDGSSIDLERELVRYMAERKVTARELLQRIGGRRRHGGPGAGHRGLHAAAGASISPSAAAPSSGHRHDGAVERPDRARRADAGAHRPRASCSSTTTPTTSTRDRQPTSRSSTASRSTSRYFDSYDVMFPRVQAGNTGFDLTFPTDTDIPGLIEQGLILPLDLSLIPNVVNLAAEWADVRPTTRATSTRCPTCGGRPASPTTRTRSTRT